MICYEQQARWGLVAVALRNTAHVLAVFVKVMSRLEVAKNGTDFKP
jgi:hypothetical protein